jgi:hypothetical protein
MLLHIALSLVKPFSHPTYQMLAEAPARASDSPERVEPSALAGRDDKGEPSPARQPVRSSLCAVVAT